MINVIRVLAPANGMDFDEIALFETPDFLGIFDGYRNGFDLIAKEDIEWRVVPLPACRSLEELDELVYEECEQHITAVSPRQKYSITIAEDA